MSYELIDVSTLKNNINQDLEKIFTGIQSDLKDFLDTEIGHLDKDITIDDIFLARLEGHPFMNLLHQIQLDISNADFSAISLFDCAIGFKKNITIKDELINYSKEHNIDNVVFLDPVKKDAIPFILSKLDVAYMSLRKESLFRFGVSPNKLFDYMMASKPILYSVEASNDPVSDANCGISVKAEDADEVVKALEKFMSLSEEERKVMGKNGKEFVIKNHKYDVLAERFLNALK